MCRRVRATPSRRNVPTASAVARTISSVNLSPEQERTYRLLIGVGERPGYDSGLAEDLRSRMEAAVGERTTPGGVWIGKRRVSEWAQCEGLLAADVLEEMPEFAHDEKSALGKIFHRAVQADVELVGKARGDGSEGHMCRYAIRRLAARREDPDDPEKFDDAFALFWNALDEPTQERILGEAVQMLATFRRVFPPMADLRADHIPSAEFRMRAQLLEGVVTMSGRVDLALGRPVDGKATRLLIDHKTGGAFPEHAEELRFYALMHTLQRGAPPYRIASYFATSGEWQAEDIEYEILEHVADRAATAARRAIDFLEGDPPEDLKSGPWCGWCPRASGCPARIAADDD